MVASENPSTEKVAIRDPRVVCVADYPKNITNDLASLYYQSWHAEGLCRDRAEATLKMECFDARGAFVVLDSSSKPIALINTLLTDCPDVTSITKRFPTYHSIEIESSAKRETKNPTFRICFSIVALPGKRVQLPGMDEDISASRFLLSQVPDNARKIVYSRWPAVGMHQHFGAEIVATIDNSRPEDTASKGQNVLLLYP